MKDGYQCVYIDGAQSSFHRVDVGVPQGSILGPLFYILFTNDLPEIIHEESCPLNKRMVGIFNTMCPECGGLVAFADDSTVTVSDISPARLTEKLSVKFEKISEYFAKNKLKVNDEKTHLMVLTSSRRRQNEVMNVCINTPSEVISGSRTEKLLGIHINDDLKWREYVFESKSSLI